MWTTTCTRGGPALLANTLYEAGYDVESCRIYTSAWHSKLLRFANTPLGPPAFWLFATMKNRRQFIAVARNPQAPSSPRA